MLSQQQTLASTTEINRSRPFQKNALRHSFLNSSPEAERGWKYITRPNKHPTRGCKAGKKDAKPRLFPPIFSQFFAQLDGEGRGQ